ncbi:protein arginine kinase [Heliophilum fasciatum]|uniref:Protein-arginine kinase n=1 Tax=Heliophilum fasciatum TaxID=35700 RepID=A0A4R2RN98_9FIRM|nr:protein arginine kinase [Heliophilum fasciatum]MCW2277855.1 protein arginine kinase [Heliophilum fasciatum]TCP64653.1 protein arginine kinase [Heliophilum fasciatum]
MTEALFNQAITKWMEGTGQESTYVISSRVRLARNLQGMPFPHALSTPLANDLVQQVKTAVVDDNDTTTEPLYFIDLKKIAPLDRGILVDKHLISPQHAEEADGRGLLISADESIAILINEEDHLRVQSLLPGLQLDAAWQRASSVDDRLEAKLDFAFNERLGYLTACPTNVGTGLRASVMMHLPALVLTNQASRQLNSLAQLGMTVRGLHGEGSEATGHLFQISNQVTLGRSEEEIISNLAVVTRQLIDQERLARHMLQKETQMQLEDRIFRAYGLLTSARILSSQEAMSQLSYVRMGVDLGLIPDVAPAVLNEMLVLTRPAFLQKAAGREMNPLERDIQRATLMRARLLQGKHTNTHTGGCCHHHEE